MPGPVLDFDPQSSADAATPQADTRERPSTLGLVDDQWRVARDENHFVQQNRLREKYEPVIEALVERGVSRESLQQYDGLTYTGMRNSGDYDRAKIWREIRRQRQQDPAAFAELGQDQQTFERPELTRNGQRAADQAEIARGTFGQQIASALVGGGSAEMTKPFNLATIAVGGTGKTVARKLVTEFLAQSAIEAAQTGGNIAGRAALGEDTELSEILINIFGAGFAGATLRGGAELAPGIDAKALELTRPLREAIDARFADQDLANALSRAIPEDLRTPEQAAAIEVLSRSAEIEGSSPYVETYEGLDTHVSRLTEAMAALEEGRSAQSSMSISTGVRAGEPVENALSPQPARQLAENQSAVSRVLRDAGYSDEVVAGFLGNFEVEGGYGGALGDGGTASGIAQWRHERRANFRKLFGKDPHMATVAEQAQFVLWEMENPGKAGMTKKQRDEILNAPTPEKAAELIDKYFERSSGAHRQRRIDEARGFYGGEAAPVGSEEIVSTGGLQLRPEALDAERPTVAVGGRAVPTAAFAADDIGVDAELMQFKSGGDQFGVTERLQGVEEWDPIAAGMVTIWEAEDGRRLIADGHQRLGLARRIQQTSGQEVSLNAFVLRESEGFSAVDARILTALKNIGEGTGTAADAAKVFRDVGLDAEDVLKRLPPRSALVRDGKALSRLGDEAFGAVINEVIPENYGAAIGALVPDATQHMAMVRILAETDPPNRVQAEAIIRQAKEAGFRSETQDSLFGSEELVTGLFAQRAKVLDRGLKELRKMKGAFSVAVRNAETLEAGGNRIDVNASAAAVEGNALALALIDRLALRKGNAVNELLDQAANRLADGEPLARVLKDFVAEVRKLDLDSIARKAGSPGRNGDGDGGSGRAGEPFEQAGDDSPQLTDRDRDALEAREDLGPNLFDDDTAAARFDDPAGEGVREVSESIWHDIRAEIDRPTASLREDGQADFAAPTAEQVRKGLELKTEGRARGDVPQKGAGEDGGLFDNQDTTGDLFDLGDGRGARSAADIRAELDRERAGLDEMRNCLK